MLGDSALTVLTGATSEGSPTGAFALWTCTTHFLRASACPVSPSGHGTILLLRLIFICARRTLRCLWLYRGWSALLDLAQDHAHRCHPSSCQARSNSHLCWPDTLIRRHSGHTERRIVSRGIDTKQRICKTWVYGMLSSFLADNWAPITTVLCTWNLFLSSGSVSACMSSAIYAASPPTPRPKGGIVSSRHGKALASRTEHRYICSFGAK